MAAKLWKCSFRGESPKLKRGKFKFRDKMPACRCVKFKLALQIQNWKQDNLKENPAFWMLWDHKRDLGLASKLDNSRPLRLNLPCKIDVCNRQYIDKQTNRQRTNMRVCCDLPRCKGVPELATGCSSDTENTRDRTVTNHSSNTICLTWMFYFRKKKGNFFRIRISIIGHLAPYFRMWVRFKSLEGKSGLFWLFWDYLEFENINTIYSAWISDCLIIWCIIGYMCLIGKTLYRCYRT